MTHQINHNYFIVMIDYGRKGLEAIVDPELTYSNVVDRVRSGEYKNIAFIHSIHDGACEDVTSAVLEDAAGFTRKREVA